MKHIFQLQDLSHLAPLAVHTAHTISLSIIIHRFSMFRIVAAIPCETIIYFGAQARRSIGDFQLHQEEQTTNWILNAFRLMDVIEWTVNVESIFSFKASVYGWGGRGVHTVQPRCSPTALFTKQVAQLEKGRQSLYSTFSQFLLFVNWAERSHLMLFVLLL